MTYIGEVLKNGINVQKALRKLRKKVPETEVLILHPSPGHRSFILIYQENLESLYK